MDQSVHADESTTAHAHPDGWRCWLAGWQAAYSRWDRVWLTVLLVWLLTWLALARWVERHGVALPHWDDHCFVSVATGQEPLSWEFLFRPANEHRQPLTRLLLYLAGEVTSWNFRHILQINLGMLAFGVLALLVAARSVRGSSHISDCFLCLAVLHPFSYATVVWYSYSFIYTLALFCVSLALLANGWALRGRWHLIVYFLTLLALVLAGGAPGQIWAVGMCGVVVVLWIRRRAWSWQLVGWSGTLVVTAVALAFLWLTPKVPFHEKFLNPTFRGIASVSARQAVAWLGRPFLEVTWPWILAVLIVPGLHLLFRGGRDVFALVRRWDSGKDRLCTWVDLFPALLAILAVIGLIAYARGTTNLWVSRYHTLMVPLALVLYVLLLRVRAGVVLPTLLFVVMAMSWCWCWPIALYYTQARKDRAVDLVRCLREGREPLMHLPHRFSRVTWFAEGPGAKMQIGWWIALRDAHLSVFSKMPDRGSIHAFPTSTARLGTHLKMVADTRAVQDRAIHLNGPVGTVGKVSYTFDMPARRLCQIHVRALATTPNQSLAVTIDQRPPQTVRLQPSPDYLPCLLGLANLEPGTHHLSLTLSSPHTRIDLVEIVPVHGEKRIPVVLQNDSNFCTVQPLSD